MSNGDIVQHPAPVNTSAAVSTYTSPAFASAPTVGNTDIIVIVASTLVNTPSGYTLDASDTAHMGVYIFRRTGGVQSGDTGAAVSLTSGSGAGVACCYRYELQSNGTVDAVMTAAGGTAFSTARGGNSFTPAATCGLLVVGGERPNNATTNVTAFNWTGWNNSIVQQDASVSAGSTNNTDGIIGYVNGHAAGALTPSATSSNGAVGGTYDWTMLAVAYDFPAGATTPPKPVVAPSLAALWGYYR